MTLSTARRVAVALVFVLLAFTPAFAQSGAGIRAGVSGDPNQFFIGGHIETRPVADHLTFRPNAEIGFGSGETLITINLEFAYHVPIKHHPWSFYAGGGPAAVIRAAGSNGDSGFGGGFNFLLGLQARQGFFTELKIGVIDSPQIKFTVGYAFRTR
jgi:hypothetical protein